MKNKKAEVTSSDILKILAVHTGSEYKKYFEPVFSFAETVPAFSGNILEIHPDKSTFDFSYRINSQYDQQVLPLFKQFSETSELIVKCSNLLNTEKDGFLYGIKNIWIENDYPYTAAPVIFFDSYSGQKFDFGSYIENLKNIFSVFNFPFNDELNNFLNYLHNNNVQVVYYGLLYSRNTDNIRLTIFKNKNLTCTELLHILKWKGNYDLFLEYETKYFSTIDNLKINIDYHKKTGTRIGIEFLNRNCVQQLVKDRLLSEDKNALITNWEEIIDLPESAARQLSRMYNRDCIKLYKRVNHFKLTVDEDKVQCKAYLYYCF